MQVVRLDDYRPQVPKTVRRKSFYQLYPMPFFDRKRRCSWNVTPTGNYTADCEMGRAFAIEFLKSCDKTCGWQSLLQVIVADMIRAGTDEAGVNGVVIGFMGVIGSAVVHSRCLDRR